MAGGAGVQVQVLPSQGAAQQGRSRPAGAADCESVVRAQSDGPSGAGGRTQHQCLEINSDLADVRVGGADGVLAGGCRGGGVLDQVGAVGAAAPPTAHREDAADPEGLSAGARGRPSNSLQHHSNTWNCSDSHLALVRCQTRPIVAGGGRCAGIVVKPHHAEYPLK